MRVSDEILKTVTTEESARYLLEQIKIRSKSEHKHKLDLTVEEVERFVARIEAKNIDDSSQIWAGHLPPKPKMTEFEAADMGLLTDAQIEELARALPDEEIHVNYILKKAPLTEIAAQYSTENVDELMPDARSAMDKLLLDWYKHNRMIDIGNGLYEVNEQALEADHKIIPALDDRGNPMKVDPSTLEALINDPEKGFQNYLRNHQIHVELHQHEFEPTSMEAQEPTVPETLEMSETIETPETPEVSQASADSETPEASSTEPKSQAGEQKP